MYQPSRSEGGTLKALRTAAHQALLRILRRARGKAAFTQTELAHRLGRSQSWVSNIERGERRLRRTARLRQDLQHGVCSEISVVL